MQMIIRDTKKAEIFHCPAFKHRDEKPNDGVIPRFYTKQHAINNGWVFTKHIKFSKDGDLVAVCPECAKETVWIRA